MTRAEIIKKAIKTGEIHSLKDRVLFRTVSNDNGCFVSDRFKVNGGYRSITYKQKSFLCHRIVMHSLHGYFDQDTFVCHKCDNPPCVNPDHLFLGTRKDNVLDAIKKGRIDPSRLHKKGQNHSCAKLTDLEVFIIKYLVGNIKLKSKIVAHLFDIKTNTVHGILNGSKRADSKGYKLISRDEAFNAIDAMWIYHRNLNYDEKMKACLKELGFGE